MSIIQKFKNHIRLEIILFLIILFYYLFFINKGLILFDEGYFVHSADRILHGDLPYKDFSLQYGPTYFYSLALFFKLFGQTIIVERIFAMIICLAIIAINFIILNKLRTTNLIIILSAFCMIAFGYPLINIANIMWANVLTALLTTLVYLYWYYTAKQKAYRYLILLGFLIALSLSLKQNIGLINLLLFNFLILFSKKRSTKEILKDLGVINGIVIVLSFSWVYYFFLKNNLSGLFNVIEFSKKFASSMAFSLPPFTLLLQPTGIFKLLPYYTPIIFTFFLIKYLFGQNKNWPRLAFSLMSVTGFAVTIFPQSDLLHVYPFFASVLISILLFGHNTKYKNLILFFVLINIFTGFYLTFFTKSYRYEEYYLKANTPLSLPRAEAILLEPSDAKALTDVYNFINSHTSTHDYILSYPYAPMLYFILDRQNPTKDPIYYLRTWHFYDDKVILKDMKQKKVKFIITVGDYKFNSDLSQFIQKQKIVFSSQNYLIYEIKNE